MLGCGSTIISILDGDVEHKFECTENCKDKSSCNCRALREKYGTLKKAFLPIASVEKFLYSILCEGSDSKFKKIIGDKYFQRESIDVLIDKYNADCSGNAGTSKGLYKYLIKDLASRKMTEEKFLGDLCSDILKYFDYSEFVDKLKIMLT